MQKIVPKKKARKKYRMLIAINFAVIILECASPGFNSWVLIPSIALLTLASIGLYVLREKPSHT